jgi:hypothetical protein
LQIVLNDRLSTIHFQNDLAKFPRPGINERKWMEYEMDDEKRGFQMHLEAQNKIYRGCKGVLKLQNTQFCQRVWGMIGHS